MHRFKNLSTLSDLEVVIKWQTAKQRPTKARIEEYFYTKYRPLMTKYAYKYAYLATYEDNLQESYLQMLKALEYVDSDKIYNKEAYSFGVTFKGYLTSHYSNVRRKTKENISFEAHMDKEEQNNNIILIDERVNLDMNIKYVECCEEYLEFRDALEGNEKKIMGLMEKGSSCKQIMKKMKFKSMANVTYYTKLLKKKYIIAMNQRGYGLQYA